MGIDVPDAWANFMELPQSWQQPRNGVEQPILCLPTCTPRSSSDDHVWWQRSGSSSTDSEGSEGEMAIDAEDKQRVASVVCRALRCLMFGCFQRPVVTEGPQISEDMIQSGCLC